MATLPDVIKVIPTAYTKEQAVAMLSRHKDWFYEFKFSCGASTPAPVAAINDIHTTRAQIIFPFLNAYFRNRWDTLQCIDFACHQGWFASQVAVRGVKSLVGLDIRDAHLKMANTIKEIGALSNVAFEKRNLFEVTASEYGQFDLTLFLGILYHLDSPIEALKIARSVTRDLCVIETQVARPSATMETLWGSSDKTHTGPGICIINADTGHASADTGAVLVPTLSALYRMLYAAGFDLIHLCVPPKPLHKQFQDLDRVVVFAQVL